MPLNDNHRRVLANALRHIDGILVDIETAASSAGTPLGRFRSDIAPAQQQVIADHVAHIRRRMLEVLAKLEIPVEPPRSTSSWAIMTALSFAEIAVHETSPSRLQGYGALDPGSADAIASLEADLERSLRRLRTYISRGLDRDLGARLARLESERQDLALLRPLERIIRQRGLIEFEGTLESLLERLESRTYEVAVFGRVSSGKSSLLNTVLGLAALPVGVTPVTAVPTRVTWGDAPAAEIRFADAPEEKISLERLPEFVSEAGNPGNRKHVARATVRLPSPKLANGVVFVDTPGVGSLATSGARESYAYLPRCDLGVLLLDASGSAGLEDLEILRLLYESGIPALVALSKSDLLSETDRERMRDYLRRQIGEKLGLELPVRLVSSAGADARLAREWFEQEIAPVCARARELSEVSARRRLAALREGVEASLRALLGSRSGEDIEEARRRRARVEELALEAEARLQEATRTLEHLVEGARMLARPALGEAACELARRQSLPEPPAVAAGGVVAATLRRRGAEVRAELRDELVAARDGLRAALLEMAREIPGAEARPDELHVELVTEPSLVVPGEAEQFAYRPPRLLRALPSLLQRRISTRLLSRLDGVVSRACWAFHRDLEYWFGKALPALAAQFTAQSEPLRAQARRLAEGSDEAGRDAIASDLAQIEKEALVVERAR